MENFLNNLGIDLKETNIDKVRADIFDVEKIANIAPREGLEAPQDFHVYDSNGRCLSPNRSVGHSFTPQQPTELLEMLETGAYEAGIDLDKIEFKQYRNGSKIALRVPVGKIDFVNIAKKQDTTDVFLNLSTGFDGNTKTTVSLESWRLICTNGMKAMNTEFATSFKNTKNNSRYTMKLSEDLLKCVQNYEKMNEYIQHLNTVKASAANEKEFISAVLGWDVVKEYDEKSAKAQNQADKLQESIAIEFGRTGSTAWGLLNGATHWTNHVNRSEKTDQAEYILFASGQTFNNRAQQFVAELA